MLRRGDLRLCRMFCGGIPLQLSEGREGDLKLEAGELCGEIMWAADIGDWKKGQKEVPIVRFGGFDWLEARGTGGGVTWTIENFVEGNVHIIQCRKVGHVD